jgi:hypothetical protein
VAIAGCARVVLVIECVFNFVPDLSDAEMLKDPEWKILCVAFSQLRKSSA